jgi:hypothetical protein
MIRRLSPGLVATGVVKLALVSLLVLAVARPDLPQFEGKAMAGRALTYPIAALIVPLVVFVRGRRGRATAYPYDVDVLIVLPFLIDVVGNALDLYDSISWWDDLNHAVNWALLVGGVGCLVARSRLPALVGAGLLVGFGTVTAVLWEFAEYWTFIRHSDELATAYTDTLGDLALGMTGSVVATVVTLLVVRPRYAASIARRSASTA